MALIDSSIAYAQKTEVLGPKGAAAAAPAPRGQAASGSGDGTRTLSRALGELSLSFP